MKKQLLSKSIRFFRSFSCRCQVMLLLFMLCGQQGFARPLVDENAGIKRSYIEFNTEVSVLQTEQVEKVSGVVKDADGVTLPGVAVVLVGSLMGTATDADGVFNIDVPKGTDVRLLFSFIGMESQEIAYKGVPLQVVLKNSLEELDEVVVTGLFKRKTESFTGSVSTYKADDLKMIGRQNVLQALKTLDPSFNIMESNEFGSDPNRTPDVEIRGKSSIVGYKGSGPDPNQPLFVLDGFETSMQVIMDMNMERIASITLLKDAASTAIYGSKAANGVVVVETKAPEPGSLRVNYGADVTVSFADLHDYNLMNATEKLEFERMAGVYTASGPGHEATPDNQLKLDQVYYERVRRIKGGVDSYWLSEPIRTGFVHKHNLYLEGGDKAMRYGAGVSFGKNNGVMNNSGRQTFAANFDLQYRRGILNFSNRLNIDNLETNDPIVSFAKYADANPYYKKTEEGSALMLLEYKREDNSAYRNVYNPLYDDQQNNLKANSEWKIYNNLQVEIQPFDELQIRGRLGLSTLRGQSNVFESPFLSKYNEINDFRKRGAYSEKNLDAFSWNGEMTATFGKIFNGIHRTNLVVGSNFEDKSEDWSEFYIEGFKDDEIQNPSQGIQYPEGKPGYYKTQSRAMSVFGNLGYGYKERYLFDANMRMDGASIFGANRRYTSTWSTGVSWNIHNENFMKEIYSYVNYLKIRSSIGNPGNQNFGGTTSFNTYVYNPDQSTIGAIIKSFGNPNLDWQKTLDWNIGLDLVGFDNRFKVTLDYYRKETDPLLVVAGVASSTGKEQFTTNLGGQLTKGFTGTISFSPIYKLSEGINWTVTANFRHQKAEYINIGNNLDYLNNEMQSGTSLTRYYDGASPTAHWAVKSLGIDPMTGKEVYLSKEGEQTFTHSYKDEVVVGDSEPKLEGVVGTTLYYKGLSVNVSLRYRLGADVFNSALYDKVENITKDNWTNNLDKRALYDRWQKPGDIAQFKGISLVESPDPISSRFVQTENTFEGESFSIGYEFSEAKWFERTKLHNLTIRAYMNDIFRASTVKAERGTDYPFARSTSFAVSLTF